MKKEYISPELEVVSLSMKDVLTASDYKPQPEDPTRAGNEGLDDL